MAKLRVGVLFGGRSGEHEVSLLSAASVMDAIDKEKYEIVPIGITPEGHWVTSRNAQRLLQGLNDGGTGAKAPQSSRNSFTGLKPGASAAALGDGNSAELRAGDPQATAPATVISRGEAVIVPPVPEKGLIPFQADATTGLGACSGAAIEVDIIFPVLHGTFGEDGTVQGLLELADIPYVGAGVLGSAAGMDKDVMKRLFRDAGLPIVKHLTILRSQWEQAPRPIRHSIERGLKYPIFIKPANLGSSVGISKAHDSSELPAALEEAARYDRKLVAEQAVGGKRRRARELECAVLGNDDPQASVVGEVVPIREFYDYSAKYIEEGSQLLIPAPLTRMQVKAVQEMAVRAFQAVECAGMARVDFLMEPQNRKIYVNEVNTIPGFTSISMYPRLWAASGLPYPKLIDRLIELGLERHAEKQRSTYRRSGRAAL